jgi:hypothetical protein
VACICTCASNVHSLINARACTPGLNGLGKGEPACRPGSVHPPKRADGHPSRTAVAGSLVRSTRKHRAGSPRTLAQAGAVAGVRPLDLAPGGVYLAVAVACDAGGLLHHPFTLTLQPKLKGGLLSVALSRGSPRVGVTDHPAVWSPDLPPRAARPGATARPTHPELRVQVQVPARPRACPFRPDCRGAAAARLLFAEF